MAKKPVPVSTVKKTPAVSSKRETVKLTKSTTSALGSGWMPYLIVVLVVTFLCFISTSKNGLVNWDDDPNIKENENIERVGIDPFSKVTADIFDIEKGNVIGNYNPLSIYTFAVEKKLAGNKISPALIHVDNVILHVATVAFVFILLLQMGLGNWGAFIGALLFGIHPMRVESVAWATERKDVLFGVFFFASLVCYVKWIKTDEWSKGIGNYVLMVLLALLSMYSKVQAVTLVLSMVALDFWFERKINLRWFVEKIPFGAMALIFGLINLYTLKVQGSTEDDLTNFNLLDRLCIGAFSFCTYLYKLVFPYPMSPLYPYPKPLPITVYLAPIAFFAFWGLIWYLWKKQQRIWVFGALFFFFNVMFLLQVLGAGQGFLADRFTYVPYFGMFAIMAWYYNQAIQTEKYKSMAQIIAGVFFVFSAIMTVKQVGIWKNGETLWSHVMKYEKETNSLPYWNRGQYYRNSVGDYEAALKDYSKAVTINPKNSELYNSRGKTYFDMAMSGKYGNQEAQLIQQAIADYSKALELPNIKAKSKAEVLINRGAALGATNNFQQSIQDITEGLKLDPTNKNGYFNRSIAYYNMQSFQNALDDYQSYLKLDPYNPNIWYESGMIQRSMKKNDEAINSLSTAIRLKPDFGLAYLERARAKAQAGDKAGAQADYAAAGRYGQKPGPMDQQLMGQ